MAVSLPEVLLVLIDRGLEGGKDTGSNSEKLL